MLKHIILGVEQKSLAEHTLKVFDDFWVTLVNLSSDVVEKENK